MPPLPSWLPGSADKRALGPVRRNSGHGKPGNGRYVRPFRIQPGHHVRLDAAARASMAASWAAFCSAWRRSISARCSSSEFKPVRSLSRPAWMACGDRPEILFGSGQLLDSLRGSRSRVRMRPASLRNGAGAGVGVGSVKAASSPTPNIECHRRLRRRQVDGRPLALVQQVVIQTAVPRRAHWRPPQRKNSRRAERSDRRRRR